MNKYQFFTFKRYLEQCLMFPFVLFGRFLALFSERTNFDIFFFIPIYGLGGAEYVNAKILEALPDQKILLIFTKKSKDDTALKLFQHPNVQIKDISFWADNKLIYWANFIARGYFAQMMSRNIGGSKLFIGQCNFGYKLTPHLSQNIPKLELIHLFDERFCNVWMPFVSFLSRRICVAQSEIDKLVDYAVSVGIPSHYSRRFQELRLFVDIPDDIIANQEESEDLKIYYAGRGTAQKRLWLHFAIARRIKAEGLPISFHYVGNFEDELPKDYAQYAHYQASLPMGRPMYEFIKDKHILLLTSHSEGFPVALLEAMHFGIVPVVTPVGGMPTAIKDHENGILLRNQNEEDVVESAVEAIIELYHNTELRRRLSQNIKMTFEREFSRSRFNLFIRNFLELPN